MWDGQLKFICKVKKLSQIFVKSNNKIIRKNYLKFYDRSLACEISFIIIKIIMILDE